MKFLIALTLLLAPVFSKNLTLAVADLEPQGMSSTEAAIISDRLREELLNTGLIRVMERGMMDEILKEQSLGQSGICNSSQCQVEVGRLLGVDRLTVGRVGKFGSMYTLSVRLLNVESGEIMVSESEDHEGAMEGLLKGPLKRIAEKLTQAILPKDSTKASIPTQIAPIVNPNDTTKSKWGKRALQIGLGIITTGFVIGGISNNQNLKKYADEANDQLRIVDDLNSTDQEILDAKMRYDDSIKEAETRKTTRNLFYGLAVLGAVGFSLTFTF